MGQLSLFTEEDRLKHLSKMGDSLEKLKDIDWELFRSPLQKALRKKEKKGMVGILRSTMKSQKSEAESNMFLAS